MSAVLCIYLSIECYNGAILVLDSSRGAIYRLIQGCGGVFRDCIEIAVIGKLRSIRGTVTRLLSHRRMTLQAHSNTVRSQKYASEVPTRN